MTSKAKPWAVSTWLSLSTWLCLSPRTWTFEALSCQGRVQLAMPPARETVRGEYIETERASQEAPVVEYGSHIEVWYNHLFFQNRCYVRWDRIAKGYWIHWLTTYFCQLDLRPISGKLKVWGKKEKQTNKQKRKTSKTGQYIYFASKNKIEK